MVSTLILVGCALGPAQARALAEGHADWIIRPQLSPGHEFVYTGSYKEDATGQVEHSRSYQLEMRVLVLDAPRPEVPVAVLTVLRSHDAGPGVRTSPGHDAPVSSTRLERGSVDQRGLLRSEVNVLVPLDGPPTLEVGTFLELPGERLSLEQSWFAAEPGRPVRTWRVVGADQAGGTICVKVVGDQKTDDWDRTARDHVAWRRQDTVWLAPRAGLAYRVERIIEKREPGHDEVVQRSRLRYDLESTVAYTGQFLDERRREVTQALAFAAAAAPLLPAPARHGPELSALDGKIAFHLEHEAPTPYREAILQVRRSVEAARRGEAMVTVSADLPAESGVATRGEPAPDFVAPDLRTRGSINLKRSLGKPVLLVFFNPRSTTLEQLLHFAQWLLDAYPQRITVMGLAISENVPLVRERVDRLSLSFPLLDGTGLRRSYAVEATPKMVLLDAAGVVRGSYVGWGNEVPLEVVEELKRWLPQR
jgi:peroxiredoxin